MGKGQSSAPRMFKARRVDEYNSDKPPIDDDEDKIRNCVTEFFIGHSSIYGWRDYG